MFLKRMLIKKHWLIGLLALVLLPGTISATQDAPKQPEKDSLPGYYEFFMKTGKLVRIEPEIERDRQIQSGNMLPIAMNTPLPDFNLPLPSGQKLQLRSYTGQKNLLLVTFRSWW